MKNPLKGSTWDRSTTNAKRSNPKTADDTQERARSIRGRRKTKRGRQPNDHMKTQEARPVSGTEKADQSTTSGPGQSTEQSLGRNVSVGGER
jgi:hypothetical protein